VRVGSCISSKIPVISGVPQGSVLGPSLFLLYVNDVADIFSDLSVSLSLFADDLKLYTCYKIDALHNDLHTAVNIGLLTEWAKLWQLQIAIPKCSLFRIFNPQWHVSESVQRVTRQRDLKTCFFMIALWNRETIYIFMLWFVLSSSSFFPRLILAAADWMSAILPHMVWP